MVLINYYILGENNAINLVEPKHIEVIYDFLTTFSVILKFQSIDFSSSTITKFHLFNKRKVLPFLKKRKKKKTSNFILTLFKSLQTMLQAITCMHGSVRGSMGSL